LAYADDVNIVGKEHRYHTEKTEALYQILVRRLGLEVSTAKTKYMLMSRCKKAGQKHCIKMVNRSFEDVAKLKYLVTTVTDQNCMNEEIKSRLYSGNAYYHSLQSVLSSCLLSRNVKVKIYKIINLPVVLYGCETWFLSH
jgi:predicted nucleotidyltransferase